MIFLLVEQLFGNISRINTRKIINVILASDLFYYCVFYDIFSNNTHYLTTFIVLAYKIKIILYAKKTKITKYEVFIA